MAIKKQKFIDLKELDKYVLAQDLILEIATLNKNALKSIKGFGNVRN
jgi:hypothetical protein